MFQKKQRSKTTPWLIQQSTTRRQLCSNQTALRAISKRFPMNHDNERTEGKIEKEEEEVEASTKLRLFRCFRVQLCLNPPPSPMPEGCFN